MLAKMKSKPGQPGLEIQFDGGGGDNRIKGIPDVTSTASTKASVFGSVSPDVKRAKVKVVLKGFVRTKAIPHPPGSQSKGLWVNTETVLDATLISQTVENPDGAKKEFHVPFSFCMADFEDGSALPEDVLGRMLTSPVLPPSTTRESTNNHWKLPQSSWNSEDSFQVTYSLTAILSVEKRRIASASRKVNFIPTSSQLQPPMAICDFPDEYVLSSSRETRSMNPLGRCHCTDMEVQSEEPDPLTIRTIDSKGSTRINLMFKLEGRQADVLPKHCKVKATLVTRTFVTPHWHGKWVPTLDDTRATPSAEVQMESSHEQTYTMNISHWEALDRNASNDSHTFLATLPVRFFVSQRQLPCPTFFTPLVSRRYAVDVAVSFPEIRRSEMRLSLPLQVAYSDDAGGIEALRLVAPPPRQVRPLQSLHLAGVMLAA